MNLTQKLKQIVKGNIAVFVKYKKGNLYYMIEYINDNSLTIEEGTCIFPIPIEDTGDGQFNNLMEAELLMRWVRKHLELKNENS